MFPIRDHNPSRNPAFVTYMLMGINVAVFLAMVPGFAPDADIARLYANWAFIPARLSSGDGFLTLVTSQFLHGGFMHLAGNMLFLFVFGDNMEDEMGALPFLGFYLASGVAAALAQYAGAPMSPIPMVGASGAIAGVMGGYLLLFPRARVDVLVIFVIFFKVFPIPAWIVLGIWFVIQVASGVGTPADVGGVAFLAHAGGFVAGLAMTLPLFKRLGGMTFWSRHGGTPPHPQTHYRFHESRVPIVRRRK